MSASASEQTLPYTQGVGAEAQNHVTAKALVSRIEAGAMLTAQILLAGQLTQAHLDSCATHCFLSSSMSRQLAERGYPPSVSPITFEVSQGKPLCNTQRIHRLPMSIAREDCSISTWDDCLFVVADAGAPVIIGYAALRLGGIVKYEPPSGYIELLSQYAHASNQQHEAPRAGGAPSVAEMLGQLYHPPSRILTASLNTEAVIEQKEEKDGSKNSLDCESDAALAANNEKKPVGV